MADGTQGQVHHYTPPWLDWIATHVVPSAMIVAEGIVITEFFIVTSVRNPYAPQAWGVLEWLLVVVAFCVGAAMAGLALKLSGGAAEMLATGHVIRGGFMFVIVLALGVIETWAGIVERAGTIGIGPADLLLSDYTGVDAFRHVPTSVFIVSFILPCLVLGYGWASRPPVVESLEELRHKNALKEEKARANAVLNEIRAKGLGATARAARAGLTGKKDEPFSELSTPALEAVVETLKGEKAAKFSASRIPGKKTARQWTATDLKAYVAWAYDRELDDITAGNMIRSLGGNKQLTDVVGKPYYANNLAAQKWADGVYRDGKAADEPVAMGE